MEKIQIMRSMLEKNPENGLAWYLLGIEYVEQGNESEALYAFSQALNLCGEEFKDNIFEQLSRLSKKRERHSQADKAHDSGLPDSLSSPGEQRFNDKGEDENEDENENEPKDVYEETQENDGKLIQLSVIRGNKGSTDSFGENWNKTAVTFDNVGGYDDLKEIIRMKIIKPFSSHGLFSKYKKKTGGGILLFGPPGCGKTFIAKATAGECQAGFMTVRITDILDPYLGVSEQNIKEIFAKARSKRPCVIFFDEIDTIGFNRSKLTSEHMRPIIDQLLTEIEGIDTDTQNMLIIGATNMPWDVDPAFKRPGRFDKIIFVPPPDKKARIAILKLKMAGRPQEAVIDYHAIAERTELYSGVDIENVAETATENVLSEIMKTGIERPINTRDLFNAVDVTKPSTIEWLKTVKNYVKYSNQAGLYDDVEKYLSQKSRHI